MHALFARGLRRQRRWPGADSPPPDPGNLIEIGDSVLLQLLIARGVDSDGDGAISEEEAAQVTGLDLSRPANATEWILSLEGLEYFRALQEINLDGNKIQDLAPLQGAAATLFTLRAAGNALREADLAPFGMLRELDLSDNPLEEIDLCSNTRLRTLRLNGGLFTRIDLTSLEALEALEMSHGALTGDPLTGTVDLSGHSSLRTADLSGNRIWRIDAHNSPMLETLDGSDNLLFDVSLYNSPVLTHLDLRGNRLFRLNCEEIPAVEYLDISDNGNDGEELPGMEMVDFSPCVHLTELRASSSGLTKADFSHNPALTLLTLERMPRLDRINLRNGGYSDACRYRIVEGNAALKTVVVDDGAERLAVEELFAGSAVKVTVDPNEGEGPERVFMPSPAPTDDADDADQNPASFGFSIPSTSAIGGSIADAQAYEYESPLIEQATDGGYTTYTYRVDGTYVAYRTYYVDDSGLVRRVAFYCLPRTLALVLTDHAFRLSDAFTELALHGYDPLEYIGQEAGYYVYHAKRIDCRLTVRAVVLHQIEGQFAELVYSAEKE